MTTTGPIQSKPVDIAGGVEVTVAAAGGRRRVLNCVAIVANLVVASERDDKKISLWQKNGESVGTIPMACAEAIHNIEVHLILVRFVQNFFQFHLAFNVGHTSMGACVIESGVGTNGCGCQSNMEISQLDLPNLSNLVIQIFKLLGSLLKNG
ncbi:hypothetical protein RHGRI_009692 [Rhododendron griersonianum]|uniref:Uncharacterized protein n=1 Tax=Rhododendron griersonianum TaxID=479676 RepID=A0AAV6KFQ2_9ERIC|nr:hypothetical protein RHGRI_009692 [Rhododendron griersonianum]